MSIVKSIPGPCGLVEVAGLVGLVELDPHALPSAHTATSELSIRFRVMTGAEQAMIHSPVRLDQPLSRAIYLCASTVVPG